MFSTTYFPGVFQPCKVDHQVKLWGGYQGWPREAEDSWERRGVEQRTLSGDRDISCPGVTEATGRGLEFPVSELISREGRGLGDVLRFGSVVECSCWWPMT